MVIGFIAKLMGAVRRPRGRRLFAIFCAVTLLWVGFVHNLRHTVDAPVATLAWQMDAGSDDAADPSSKNDHGVVEHCHGCTMIAALTSMESAAAVLVLGTPTRARVSSVHPHQPSAATPPPRTAN